MPLIGLLAAAAFACTNPRPIDGDGLRCGPCEVRLAGIDAPELHGCRGHPGRRCVPGNGYAAKAALGPMVGGQALRCVTVEPDVCGGVERREVVVRQPVGLEPV